LKCSALQHTSLFLYHSKEFLLLSVQHSFIAFYALLVQNWESSFSYLDALSFNQKQRSYCKLESGIATKKQ